MPLPPSPIADPPQSWREKVEIAAAHSHPSAWRPTAAFLAQTEVHVYALSIAASVLLSFFPFLIVIDSLCRYTFHWPAAVAAINLALADYFPAELGAFLQRNLEEAVSHNGPTQFISLILFLFTANGVFEPLEVALNRVWGVKENRTYLKNQILSLGLIFFCGALVLASILLTARNQDVARELLNLRTLPRWITWFFFKLASIPLTIGALFFIYWALPNRRVPARSLIKVSLYVGLALEVLKYLFLVGGPWIMAKLTHEYGPFRNSVAILLLSVLAAGVVLAGAEFSARSAATIALNPS